MKFEKKGGDVLWTDLFYLSFTTKYIFTTGDVNYENRWNS